MRWMKAMLLCVGPALASGQPGTTDVSSRLRAQFGTPLRITGSPRTEVFAIRPGLELIANYSPDGLVCRVGVEPGAAGSREVEGVIARAVPTSVRGKKWNQVDDWNGLGGSRSTYYERVIIIEDFYTPEDNRAKPSLTVIFKERSCGWVSGRDSFDHPPAK